MPQAIGRKARIAYVEESTWGTTPSSPSMTQLKALTTGEGLNANIAELISNAITGRRVVAEARGGNIDVGGDTPFELALTGLGTLLKHAIGSVTTGMDTTQPSAITGVEILYAEKGATSGDGTLSFTATGTTLDWTDPNSGTAGTAVDVSGGGDFTLEGGTTGESITVRVDASALPGSDATDTITVSSQYKHRFTRGSLPIGLSIEKGFTDIGQYIVFAGCKIDAMTVNLENSGIATGSMSLVGQSYALNTTELGVPSEPTHVPLVHHEATLEEAGNAVDIRNLTLNLANNIESGANSYVVGSRERGSLIEGQGEMSGSLTFLYKDNTQVDKWDQETESSLNAKFSTTNGSLRLHFPRVKYFGSGLPVIETESGLVNSMSWRSIEDTSADQTDVVVELVNDEATV